jgi:hypothetical protein
MTQAITRKRALELAQQGIGRLMADAYPRAHGSGVKHATPEKIQEAIACYAELAAALAYIENMARQKEMHL